MRERDSKGGNLFIFTRPWTLVTGPFPIPESAIFFGGLDRVTAVAERLPVALVPEESRVATMRLNVIHTLGFNKPALSFTVTTEDVFRAIQKGESSFPPSSIISPLI